MVSLWGKQNASVSCGKQDARVSRLALRAPARVSRWCQSACSSGYFIIIIIIIIITITITITIKIIITITITIIIIIIIIIFFFGFSIQTKIELQYNE